MNLLNDAPWVALIVLVLLIATLFRRGGADLWTNGRIALLWLAVALFILAMLAAGH